MAVYADSRYYASTTGYVKLTGDGDKKPILFYTPDNLTNISYYQHVYVNGESLDQIAYKYLGRPELWWAIVEYNPEVVDFFNIAPGTVLRVPRV